MGTNVGSAGKGLTILSALFGVVQVVVGVLLLSWSWSWSSVIIGVYLLVLGLIVVAVELKGLSVVTQYFAFLQTFWGKGLFFIFFGTLILTFWGSGDIFIRGAALLEIMAG